MKNIKINIIALLFISLSFSCTNDFDEINQNPTLAGSAEAGAQLSGAIFRTTQDRFEWLRANLTYASAMAQHFAPGSSFTAGDRYVLNQGFASSLFTRYNGYLRDIVDLIERTKNDPTQVNINSAARIWRVYIVHRVTDLYGDVPYSEASLGFIDGNFEPKYDTQQSIYLDMLNELTEAQQNFNLDQAEIRSNVLFSGGHDVKLSKWAKFANSLRLRLAMRMSEVDPVTAQTQVEAAIQAGVMTSNDDMGVTPHDGDRSRNGNAAGFIDETGSHFFLSATLVDLLQSTNDPRLGVVGAKYDGPKGVVIDNNPANAQGLANGSDTPADAQNYTRYNFALYANDENPFIHMTYAEVEFLLAEAAVRGWGAANPATHFENGVRAAMALVADDSFFSENQNEITNTQVDDYLTLNPFDNSSLENSLAQIHNQLWVTLFTVTDGIEAYSNYRRTGFPALVPVNHPDGDTNGQIPTRLVYPENESVLNPENYQEALSRLGGQDELTGRVWWDVN